MITDHCDESDTATLAMRARSGDRAAFDLLVTSLQRQAVGYAASLLNGDRDRAQDAVQAALLEAWRDLPALRDAGAFAPWLRRIVFKQCDRLRRATRTTAALSALGDIPDSAPAPGDRLLRTERRTAVRGAVLSLPRGERDAVILFYLGGCSYRDVAEYLGVSVTAVKSRLHSARRRLRRTMEVVMEEEAQDNLGAGVEGSVELPPEDLRGIEAAYRVLTKNFPTRDADLTLSLFTPDYELIFPEWFNEPTWDWNRLERDVRRAAAKSSELTPLKITVVIDDVLAMERDPETGAVTQTTVRNTWLKEGGHNNTPITRIDTWIRTPEGWKMRRTLSLAERSQEK